MTRRPQSTSVGRIVVIFVFVVLFALMYNVFSSEKPPPEIQLRSSKDDLDGWYQQAKWNTTFDASFCPAYLDESYGAHAPQVFSVSPLRSVAKVLHECRERFDVGVVSFDNIPGESFDDTIMYFWMGILLAPSMSGKITWGCTTFHWLGHNFEAMREFPNILISGGRWQLGSRKLALFSHISSHQRVGFLLKGAETCLPFCGAMPSCTYDPARLARVGDNTYAFGLHIYQDCLLLDRRKYFQFPLGPSAFTGFPSTPEGVEEMLGFPIPPATDRNDLLFAMVSGPFEEKYGRAQAVQVAAEMCQEHSCHVQSFSTRALFFAGKALEYLQPSRREQPWRHSLVQRATAAYASGLAHSVFTLCPCGKNPESYRIYEAMLAGSIPIVHNSSVEHGKRTTCFQPYKFLADMGAPILFVQSWDELPTLLAPYIADRTLALKLQRKMISWYRDEFVPKLRALSVGLVETTMHPS